MSARKCIHAQKPYSFQVFAHESSKVGGRGKNRGEDKDRNTEARRLMERKFAQQIENLSEEFNLSVLIVQLMKTKLYRVLVKGVSSTTVRESRMS